MEGVLVLKPASRLNSPPPSLQDPQEDSDLPASPDSAMIATAVPPPPPPPPPPPLPPPLHPPTSFSSHDAQRRSMKKLNWDTIPSQFVVGKLNVWTSKRPQRKLVLDVRTMEELFSHAESRASLRRSRVVGLRRADGVDAVPQEPQVTILDSKRSMNIGIFLRHFKRPAVELVEDVRQGNWLRFGPGKLRELRKLLPEQSEVKQLQSFCGNLCTLHEADQFMVLLIKVPGYGERLKAMVLREEFFPLMEEVKTSVTVMTKAANELLDCDDLHSVIRLVLKAGNYMNAGGYTANAIGFKMSSLLNLADTKANKPGMNLMHYVAKQAEDIDAELLTFPRQLDHIGPASRICKEEVIADFQKEVSKMKDVKSFSSKQPGLLQQMETFFMRAEARLAEVETSLQELNALSTAVAEYFCEDPATFRLEECCSTFHSFCKRFDRAVQENRERAQTEKRHKCQESIRVAAKRRSAGSSSTGVELNEDSSGLESALHSLLSTVPDGLTRSRRTLFPLVEGSLPERASQTTVAPRSSRESPEKKQLRLQMADKETAKLEAKKRSEMVGKSNGSFGGDRASGGPQEIQRDPPSTPSTPQPRTRDFFFANNGELGSPWTILSPITCTRTTNPLRSRVTRQQRPSSSTDSLDDGVWEGSGSSLHRRPSSLSEGSASLHDCFYQSASSQSPVTRSVSMEETDLSPVAGLQLGNLFQRSVSHMCASSCRAANMSSDGSEGQSRAEAPASSSGFMSFFRRIRSRSKPGDSEEEHFKDSKS